MKTSTVSRCLMKIQHMYLYVYSSKKDSRNYENCSIFNLASLKLLAANMKFAGLLQTKDEIEDIEMERKYAGGEKVYYY